MCDSLLRKLIKHYLFLKQFLLVSSCAVCKRRLCVQPPAAHHQKNHAQAMRQGGSGFNKAVLACSLLLIVNHSVFAGPDACSVLPSSIICSGDQSDGIGYSPSSSFTLIIEDLIKDIRPAETVSGIYLSNINGKNFNLSFDGSGDVFTAGENAYGFYIDSKGKNGRYADWTYLPLTDGDDGENGNPGGRISVTNYGNITTGTGSGSGNNSVGIMLRSLGGQGGEGGGASGGSAGAGGRGGNGNTVSVYSSGTITTGSVTTLSENSAGIYARSGGGNGAKGGESFIGAGGDGGAGGNGGTVTIEGNGEIDTFGSYSNGIFAISQAGDGGNAGEGHWTGPGGNGGIGGDGEAVVIDGSWSIITWGDDSHGIAAHSMGGTGGEAEDGGWISGGGGSGGGSGDGGTVTVNYTAAGEDGLTDTTIDTSGDDSHGIFAQSVGGYAGSGADGGGIFSSSGGDGGSAGHGGDVMVFNSGIVRTSGERSNALFAESVGGGGGSSGDGSGLFGGDGGGGGESSAGGDGGVVTVDNAGLLQTDGSGSMAIFAQSVGGSGGNAGASRGAWYSVGASGGKGGDGNAVVVNNIGDLETSGTDGIALFAQSIGGGGGNGGDNIALGSWGSVSVGGSGGDGGSGGNVQVNSNDSLLRTEGSGADGILAQSVGGGGGKGGYSFSGSGGLVFSGSLSVGGTGGGGGDGGLVTVSSFSDIKTSGEDGDGIAAESVGGGGGDGGWSIALALSDEFAGSFSVGGSGGAAGHGKSVLVESGGVIQTLGSDAAGISAQSIGGGGGDGGWSITGAGSGVGALSVGVGGSGSSGGDGGDVTVKSNSAITTFGSKGFGILAKSIGGGGGDGGWSISGAGAGGGGGAFSLGGSGGSGGNADSVLVESNGAIATSGSKATGIVAKSIGGGGGDGGWSIAGAGGGVGALSVSIGGSGARGGYGDSVTVSSRSDITTGGVKSLGIHARSIGGGGGDGGFSMSGAGAGEYGASFSLGGSGGAGGNADAVIVNSMGSISTVGTKSTAILAESIGGGGGDGGWSITGAGGGWGGMSVGIGGSGAGGGDGSSILVNNDGALNTIGDKAYGIRARSLGGGGGDGGFSIAVAGGGEYGGTFSLGGGGDKGGSASTVEVNNSAAIMTQGKGAAGMLAESVGGGGGDGGWSLTGAGGGAGGLSIGIGGFAGPGGVGDDVSVKNSGSIITGGEDAHGIRARSLGGGGGAGGFSIVAAGSDAGTFKFDSVALSLGGWGGDGNGAGDVDVTMLGGSISTQGNNAYGILAESLGGGGGSGGFSISSAISTGDTGFSLSVGGKGGDGGEAGAVTVTGAGEIITQGVQAHGISAESLGGGGGNGGFSIAGTLASDGGVSISVGGFGGKGASGDRVQVTNTGSIETVGDRALGVRAISTGGGGGDGGFSVAGAIAFSKGSSVIDAAFGGWGGSGNTGGEVKVDNLGGIKTSGLKAHGLFVQSKGGSGGNGGFSAAGGLSVGGKTPDDKSLNLAFSLGGIGGDGGTGGKVFANNSGQIMTGGDYAYGIFAESLGGGGGSGGNSITAIVGLNAKSKAKSINLGAAVGGFGGDGNKAGEVIIINSGDIETEGTASHAVYAQSVGGGGGDAGNANTLSLQLDKSCWFNKKCKKNAVEDNNVNVKIAVGGYGGKAGDGNTIEIKNEGSIITRGAGSDAILAQSIGGGGGNGGNGTSGLSGIAQSEAANKALGLVDVVAIPWTSTKYLKDWDIVVGGDGGSSGDGGNVTIDNTGTIVTYGASVELAEGEFISRKAQGGYGIIAQSIGGGGGVGIESGEYPGAGGDASVGLTGKLGLGGGGGSAGDGGRVDVSQNGDMQTYGSGAHAIIAQSIGGGGGIAGDVHRFELEYKDYEINTGLNLAFAQPGGNGGDGDDVSVTVNGDITTEGDIAYGVVAQSIGGGGGLAGSPGNVLGMSSGLKLSKGLFFGSVGGDGSGGSVAVIHKGNIKVLGDWSTGIFAQSAGGDLGEGYALRELRTNDAGEFLDGDGNVVEDRKSLSNVEVDFIKDASGNNVVVNNDDLGGDVNVDLDGDVLAYGENSSGIVAQSLGGDGIGDISIAIQGGTVQGGTENGVAVKFIDGGDNVLINRGAIQTLSDNAVFGGDGNESLDNYGTISGGIELGAGSNAFTNHVGAVFNSGAKIELGTENVLKNSGSLSPGGIGKVQLTELIGNYLQTSDGGLSIDVDVAKGGGDRLKVSGGAQLAGEISVSTINMGRARPGSYEHIALSADAGISDDSLDVILPSSVVVKYDFEQLNANELVIRSSVDFSPPSDIALTSNSRSIGRNVNDIQLAGGSEAFAPVASHLIKQPDSNSLVAAYKHLSPAPLLSSETANVNASLYFNEAMLSCRQRADPHKFVKEGECDWIQVLGRTFDRNASDTASGFSERAFQISGGAQRRFSEKWHRGWALSYERSKLELDSNLGKSVGDRFQIGGVLKGNFGSTTFSSALGLGYSTYDTNRNTGLTTPFVVASSKQALTSLSLHLRFARIWSKNDHYIRPMIDGGISFVHFSSFNESGAGGANLRVQSHNENYPSIQPAVEIGGEFKRDNGTLLRPYLKLGMTHFFDGTAPEITASFEGAPEQVGTFTVQGETDRTYSNVTLGVDMLKANDSVLRLYYNGQFSRDIRGHVVAAKYSWKF